MNNIKPLAMAISLSVLVGCASKTSLKQDEIQERYPDISRLEQALEVADQQEVDLLSQKLYASAQASLAKAKEQAKKGDDKALNQLQAAESALQQAEANAQIGRDELGAVMRQREKARAAGAPAKYATAFANADKALIDAGNLIAKGDLAEVREDRQALQQRYAKMEVDSLKQATVKDVEALMQQAKRQDVEDYAPQTLEQARQELGLAKSVLESDVTATQTAAMHASNADGLVRRAIHMSALIKEFRQSDMSEEQRVLWYQDQLSKVVAPLDVNPQFGQPNKQTIEMLAGAVGGVKSDLEQTRMTLAQAEEEHQKQQQMSEQEHEQTVLALRQNYEQQLAQLTQDYAALQSSSQATIARNEQLEAKFRSVQEMFNADEAEVYRQGDDVLIRAYGFNFPSGTSEIQSNNFPLLKKIIGAIEVFPQSNVAVSGHTDNRGSDELNQQLSQDRAQTVARFLVDVGNLAEDRVSSNGYGKNRPLASNETADGRAANRRVEILIDN